MERHRYTEKEKADASFTFQVPGFSSCQHPFYMNAHQHGSISSEGKPRSKAGFKFSERADQYIKCHITIYIETGRAGIEFGFCTKLYRIGGDGKVALQCCSGIVTG